MLLEIMVSIPGPWNTSASVRDRHHMGVDLPMS
jgi:hypothetical protein